MKVPSPERLVLLKVLFQAWKGQSIVLHASPVARNPTLLTSSAR